MQKATICIRHSNGSTRLQRALLKHVNIQQPKKRLGSKPDGEEHKSSDHMSAATTGQKTQRASKKGKSKRKAKSPLLAETYQTGLKVGEAPVDANVNKRQHRLNSDNMASPINSMNSMNNTNMNMNQQPLMATPITPINQYPYGIQTPPQYFPNMSPAQQDTPPWATEFMNDMRLMKEDMKLMKQSIPKIDHIQQTVDKINTRMTEIEEKMKAMESRVTETESSCSFMSARSAEQTAEIKRAKQEIKALEKKCSTLKQTCDTYDNEQKRLGTKLCDLESRSMRENLIFYGIQEIQGENCEDLVKTFVREELGETTEITIDRAHRLGASGARKPRPIVIKFHEYRQREQIRQKGFEARGALKAKGLGVGIQQPKEVREARRQLYPIMKREEEAGKRVRLVGDKLYVNGTLYRGTQNPASAD